MENIIFLSIFLAFTVLVVLFPSKYEKKEPKLGRNSSEEEKKLFQEIYEMEEKILSLGRPDMKKEFFQNYGGVDIREVLADTDKNKKIYKLNQEKILLIQQFFVIKEQRIKSKYIKKMIPKV